jgi:hypothetical protein
MDMDMDRDMHHTGMDIPLMVDTVTILEREKLRLPQLLKHLWDMVMAMVVAWHMATQHMELTVTTTDKFLIYLSQID